MPSLKAPSFAGAQGSVWCGSSVAVRGSRGGSGGCRRAEAAAVVLPVLAAPAPRGSGVLSSGEICASSEFNRS